MNDKVILKDRRVNLFDGDNFKCLLLGKLGFSGKLISEKTGLSKSQIYFRLRRMSIRLKDYRDGESPESKFVLNKAGGYVEKNLSFNIKRLQIQKQRKNPPLLKNENDPTAL